MERFCATCGTRLEPPAESCPCCGRQIDWDAASQPLSFVKQESVPAAQADADAGAEGSLEELEEKDIVYDRPGEAEPEPDASEADAQEELSADVDAPCDLQLEYLSQEPAPAPLEFSDAVVMCIYAMVPLAGLILLTLVMLFSDEEDRNRRTLAKALLVAHLGLMLLLVVGWFALRPLVASYMMSGYGMLG